MKLVWNSEILMRSSGILQGASSALSEHTVLTSKDLIWVCHICAPQKKAPGWETGLEFGDFDEVI